MAKITSRGFIDDGTSGLEVDGGIRMRGPLNNSAATMATVAALSATDDSAELDGASKFVSSVRSDWILDKTSTATIDGISVIATASGTGRWVRRPEAHPSWLQQYHWEIDPVNGNDENSGLSGSNAPIKTHAELMRRWGLNRPFLSGTVSTATFAAGIQLTTVNLLADLPSTDPIFLHCRLPQNGLLAYMGTATTVATGTFTAVTAMTRSANIPLSATDSTITWSSHIGRRLRVTSGSNIGQIGWIAKDLGSGSVRLTIPLNPNLPTPADKLFQTSVTSGTFSVNDPFVIEELSTAYVDGFDVESSFAGTALTPTVGFSNIYFKTNGSFAVTSVKIPTGEIEPIYKSCRFQRVLVSTQAQRTHFINCGFDSGINNVAATTLVYGGLSRGSINLRRGAFFNADYDFMIQGNILNIFGGAAILSNFCVFDATNAIKVSDNSAIADPRASCFIAQSMSGQSNVWGSGSTGPGITVFGGGIVKYQSTIPTITGAGGDFKLAGASVGRAWDESTGAYTSVRQLSWANLSAVTGSGGFSGNAHNVAQDAHIVKGD